MCDGLSRSAQRLVKLRASDGYVRNVIKHAQSMRRRYFDLFREGFCGDAEEVRVCNNLNI
jgi:hypothetical protein